MVDSISQQLNYMEMKVRRLRLRYVHSFCYRSLRNFILPPLSLAVIGLKHDTKGAL